MKGQKYMLQTKEQGKNVPDQINEDERGNLPEKEFRVMIVKYDLKFQKQNGENTTFNKM